MTVGKKWSHEFEFMQSVKLALSGERGIIIGKYISNQYCVRYVNGAGVLTEQVWSADSLVADDEAAAGLLAAQP